MTAEIPEIVSAERTRIVAYTVTIEIWTAQDMSGSSGDQIGDQGNLMRSLESVLSYLTPGQPWGTVTGFLHCQQGETTLAKDQELYLGKDVLIGTMNWTILTQE